MLTERLYIEREREREDIYSDAVYTVFCESEWLAVVGKALVVEWYAFDGAVDLFHDLSGYVLFVHSAVFVAEPAAVDTPQLFEKRRFAAAARAQKQQFMAPFVIVPGRIQLVLHFIVHIAIG